MFSLTYAQVERARGDLALSLAKWRVWHLLAWQDVRQRYRRSTLGPFWLTFSMGIQVFVMGVVTALLFHQPFNKSLPYVALGVIFWTMISGIITDGASAFVSSTSWILQINLPLGMYVFQRIWSNVITMAHNLVIFVILIMIYSIFSPTFVIFLVALPLVVAAISWAPLLIAIVATRFRDLPVIITNIFSLLFWATPVVYFPAQLGSHRFIVALNPFTYMLDILREPLLGTMPSLRVFLAVIVTGIVGWGITFPFFARFRGRVAYWL